MSVAYMGRTKNPLLVKDDVGRAKASCYDLPGEEFAYGRPDNPDFEGAREVTMTWVSHVARPRVEDSIQDFRKLNKLALKSGALKASDQRIFRKGNQVALAPNVGFGPPPKVYPSEVMPSFTYGKQGRPSTPIAAIISNQFAAEYEQAIEDNYAQYEQEKQEMRGMRIQTTKASEGHATRARKVIVEEKKEPFKLSKFKNVKARMVLPGNESRAQRVPKTQASAQSADDIAQPVPDAID